MKVDFYHLVASPLDRILPRIAEKVLADGGRLLVVAGAAEMREGIDRSLWTYAPDSFLPHAQAGGAGDADQPVLIADGVTSINRARNIALADGVWRDEALAFDRAFHFFDADSLVAARAAWKALKARDDVEPRYWKQDNDGRWSQAA